MRKITFIKFIYINKKVDEWMMMPKSIITYLSKPWKIQQFRIKEPEEGLTYQMETKITEYRKLLIINLWFVEFRFDWVKKISYPQSDVASDIR